MRFLDLFSGAHSVGNFARELGYEVVSLDLHDATICCDVLKWNYHEFPVGHFDVIWASPPCETFSKARLSNINRNGFTRESIELDMIERGVPVLRKTQEIVAYFQPRTWFLENPQTGFMKNFMNASIPFYDVDYCKYTNWGYRKRTRIWYGGVQNENFIPLLCRKDCGYVFDGRHLMVAIGSNNKNKGQGGGKDRNSRYKIPEKLLRELLPPVLDFPV